MDRNEAIEVVKKNWPSDGYTSLREALEVLVPELKDSEDERIRKELIGYLVHRADVTAFLDETKDCKRWIAHLEKQKEQKPTAEEILIKAGLKPFKDGNQWCILVGDNIQEGVCGFGDTIEDALYEFLKDVREQQKPTEWSEKDETAFNDLMWCIQQANKSAKDENDMGNIWFAENWAKNRLKSLRPQPHWKPSEEQMNALKVVARGFPTDDPDAIDSLLTDLQKLL